MAAQSVRCGLMALLLALLPFGSVLAADYPPLKFVEKSAAAGLPNAPKSTFGLSVGDLNGDGWMDVFANNHALRNSIFLNDPDRPGRFREVHRQVDAEHFWDTREAPGKPLRAWRDTHGATWMDFDNDGDQDLLITTGVCCDPDFFINDGGLLYHRTDQLGLGNNSDREGRSSLWYDSNGDGLLEMSFITSFTTSWRDQAGGQFFEDPATNFHCARNLYGVQVDITGDPNLEMLCITSGGQFAKVWDVSTRPFRLAWDALPNVQAVNDVVLGDFDNNGRTDMLLLKGALRPSDLTTFARPEQGKWGIEALVVSTGRGFSFRTAGTLEVHLNWNATFKNFSNVNIGSGAVNPADELSFVLDPSDPRVVGVPARTPDLREVGIGYDPGTGTWHFDVYEGGANFLNAYLVVTSNAPISNVVTRGFGDSYNRPKPATLLSNTPQGVVDATAASGLSGPLPCASGVAGDFDNDMDLDVYLVCRSGTQNLPNVLLENDGRGRFTVVPDAAGAGGITGLSFTDQAGNGDSVVSLDYDNDGRLDLMVANGLNLFPAPKTGYPAGGPYELFRNTGWARNWLQIDLVGTRSSRDAIGARVYVDAGGVRQFRQQDGGLHRWSQNAKRMHFGLKGNTRATVTVHWPSGTVETFPNVASKRIYRITEGSGIEAIFPN